MASSIVFCVSLSLMAAGRHRITLGLGVKLGDWGYVWLNDSLPFYLYLAMAISTGTIIGIFLNAIIGAFPTKK